MITYLQTGFHKFVNWYDAVLVFVHYLRGEKAQIRSGFSSSFQYCWQCEKLRFPNKYRFYVKVKMVSLIETTWPLNVLVLKQTKYWIQRIIFVFCNGTLWVIVHDMKKVESQNQTPLQNKIIMTLCDFRRKTCHSCSFKAHLSVWLCVRRARILINGFASGSVGEMRIYSHIQLDIALCKSLPKQKDGFIVCRLSATDGVRVLRLRNGHMRRRGLFLCWNGANNQFVKVFVILLFIWSAIFGKAATFNDFYSTKNK